MRRTLIHRFAGLAGFLVALYTGIVTIAPPALCAPGVVLVENAQPRSVIVAGTDPEDREAARELAFYIRKATGAEIPVGTGTPSGARILVGAHACPPAVRAQLRKLNDDGFLIRTLPGNSVALAGNGKDGTAFAVYSFLERYLGVRWLWPGELGEVVPKTPTLRIAPVALEMQPAYLWRNLGPAGPLWRSMDKRTAESKLGVSEEHQRLQRSWEKHNRFGGLRLWGGHAFGEILPPARYGKSHPEYYALVNGRRAWKNFDGKHGAQPCTTHPDVIRITTEHCQRFFNDHPDYDGFSISLNDSRGFCECDRCLRLDSGALATAAEDPEGGPGGRNRVITDRILIFANLVADAIALSHPGKKLVLYAYGPYRQPPTHTKVRDNLIIQYTFHAADNWDPQAEAQQFRETGAWSSAARNLAIYEYFIQGNSPDLPRLMLEPIRRSVQHLYAQGYRYYQTQAGDGYAINGLNYYVLARLLWDPNADVAAIVSDYCERGFGKAAPAVARYFHRLEDAWTALRGRPVALDKATPDQYRSVAAALAPDLREACRRDLEEAASLADGSYRARVQFLQKGLQYVDMTASAVEKTIEVGPGKALEAWLERDRYVESLKQDFAIAYFWIRYNDESRTFVPLRAIRDEQRARIKTNFFVPQPLPELDSETHSRFEPEPGVTAERVTYATEYGMRVPAILYLPKAHSARIPALIIVNGHGGDKYSWYSFYSGVLYARAGAAVLTYDPAGEGERNRERLSGTRAHDKLTRDPLLGRRLAGLMMTDVMQAVSYLRERPEVDPERIAAMGYSLGSFVVALAGAVDPRLNACVLVGGGNLDGPGGYWDRAKPLCSGFPYQSLGFLGDRPAVIYSLHASRGPTLIINGMEDSIVRPGGQDYKVFFAELQKRVDMPGRVFDTEFILGGGHRPYFVTRPAALWLERRLDFPNWTEDGIRSMPETHIGEWAVKRQVDMDPGYFNQLSEAGTRAVGSNVPALTRDQLNVFSPEAWEREKHHLLLEDWVDKTSNR